MSTTHDYTRRHWGHDVAVDRARDGGTRLDAHGWGTGIAVGHYLILPIPGTTRSTRYQVTMIRYTADPPDMWFAQLRFAPRTEEEPA